MKGARHRKEGCGRRVGRCRKRARCRRGRAQHAAPLHLDAAAESVGLIPSGNGPGSPPFDGGFGPRGLQCLRQAWAWDSASSSAKGMFRPTTCPLRKFQLPVEGGGAYGTGVRPAISPDGTMVAYPQGNSLWIRDLDQVEPREFLGTKRAWNPFWSPDSKFVGYKSHATLKRVSAQGGPSSTICEIPQGLQGLAATWGLEGAIVLARPRGLVRGFGSGW